MAILLLVIMGVSILIAAALIHSQNHETKETKNVSQKISPYIYQKKEYIMTFSESQLFRRLESIVGIKYYIFPQVHLSSILKHEIKNGQNWQSAFNRINQKSVDFVLVDRTSLKTVFAIELDDRSHDISLDRTNRDIFVNEICKDAGVKLIRLRNIKGMSDEVLVQRIKDQLTSNI